MVQHTPDWSAAKALAERHKIAPRNVKISDPSLWGGKAGRRTLRDNVRHHFTAPFAIHAELYGPQPKRRVVAGMIGGALITALVPAMLVGGAIAWGFVK